MKNIDLTFGIPVFNSEKYLDDLLSCFYETSEFTYEIILINDGSSDNSLQLCEKLKKKYDFLNIRVFTQLNKGVSFTRNRIIKLSKGEWITFIDSDDTINFNEYIKIFSQIINGDCEYAINIFDKKIYNRILNKKNYLPYLISKEIINSPCTKFYKKNILNNKKIIFNEKFDLGEDLLFNLNYFFNVEKIKLFCDDIYNYRKINDNSLTKKVRNDKFCSLMSLNSECINCFDNYNCELKVYKSIEYIRIKNCFSCLKNNSIMIKKDFVKYISEMKKYKKKKYIFLNSLFETLVYYIWYICPIWVFNLIFYKGGQK